MGVLPDIQRLVDNRRHDADQIQRSACLYANLERLERLDSDLRRVERAPAPVPLVFALTKRDLEESTVQLVSVDELREALRWPVCRYVETSAVTGRRDRPVAG